MAETGQNLEAFTSCQLSVYKKTHHGCVQGNFQLGYLQSFKPQLNNQNLQQSHENSAWAHLGTIPISNKRQKSFYNTSLTCLSTSQGKSKDTWRHTWETEKHRNYRFHRAKYHPSSTLQTNLQPELFYDSTMLYLTLIRWRGQQAPVCRKISLQFTKLSSILSPKKDLQDFSLNHSKWNLTQFVLQAWLQWRQEINCVDVNEHNSKGFFINPIQGDCEYSNNRKQ